VWCRQGSNAVGGHYTTRLRNAHRTDGWQQREVLYPWHPWAGCIVHVHEVIEKAAGEVLRCSRDGGAPGRWLELPVWMFDRAACVPMQVAARPHVGLAALSALCALLGDAVGGDQTSSNTPDWGAARESHDPNRGDAHATPTPSSCEPSEASPTTRSIRSAKCDGLPSISSGMAAASGRDPPGGNESLRSPPPRRQLRRSRSKPDGGDR
jgi:hypothetical protein